MLKPSVSSSTVMKVSADAADFADDLLAAEEPLEIRVGFGTSADRRRKSISVTMRTPGNDFELALGFLFTEGVIRGMEEVERIMYCTSFSQVENKDNIVRVELKENVEFDFEKLQRNFYTTSSCGVCGKASIDAVKTVNRLQSSEDHLSVSSALLRSLPDLLRAQQNVFEYTGGLHASALFDHERNIIFSREDIGRHNALDKVIGASLGKNLLPLNQHILLLSGRASFELVQKASMAGIKIVAAIGAPSSLAVAAAKELNMTLIGFLRGNRFNIYTGNQRINIS
jgi:FdhD protein